MITPHCQRAVEDALRYGNALLKFITPNNVGLTGSHECGYLLPTPVWHMYTDKPPTKGVNSPSFVDVLWQDGRVTNSRIMWYGRKKHEYRMTRFGKDFPFLVADTVGNLLVLIAKSLQQFNAYVLDTEEDIDEIQASLGVEVMGWRGKQSWAVFSGGKSIFPQETPDLCIERHFHKFANGLNSFPSTKAFSDETINAIKDCIHAFGALTHDEKLIRYIEKEYALFRLVERQICSADVVRPFKDVDDFLATASSIMNRRKARAGRSLENHVQHLLRESRIPFDARPRIDGTDEPDILIPGKAAYEDGGFPTDRLCMIGVKTTCKDRWRQVLNEAKRIPHKHILTIQPSISKNQLEQMRLSNVTLIVPKKLQGGYPKDSGVQILTFDGFINAMRQLNPGDMMIR